MAGLAAKLLSLGAVSVADAEEFIQDAYKLAKKSAKKAHVRNFATAGRLMVR